MKQTAVEWLRELYENQPAYDEFILDEQWEQAKEMEKEQIKEAYSMGRLNKSIKEFNNNFKTEQQ
jgi:hypothetical protein